MDPLEQTHLLQNALGICNTSLALFVQRHQCLGVRSGARTPNLSPHPDAHSHVVNDHADNLRAHMTAFFDCDDLRRRLETSYVALVIGMHVAHHGEGEGVG